MYLLDYQYPAYMLHPYLTAINWSERWLPYLSQKKKKVLEKIFIKMFDHLNCRWDLVTYKMSSIVLNPRNPQ